MKKTLFILSLLFIINGIATACTYKTPNTKDNIKNNSKESKITADKIIKQIQKDEPVYYKDAVISGDLDFTAIKAENDESIGEYRSYINSSITFINCSFEGKLIASRKDTDNKANHYVTFSKNLTFINSEFKAEVNFSESNIIGIVNFAGSTFDEITSFEGAVFFSKSTFFSESNFKKELKFQRTVFEGNAEFLKCTFEGITSFQSAVLKGNAQFGATKFEQYADFTKLNSSHKCNFLVKQI